MRILNKFNGQIFWRAFKGDDTAFMFGLAEGFINKDQIGGWREDSFPNIKIEIKAGDRFLTRAGQFFEMKDDLIVDGNGRLAKANVSITAVRPVTKRVAIVDFHDNRRSTQAVPITEEILRQHTQTVVEAITNTQEHAQTWTVGGEIGGELKGVEGSVSAEFQDEVKITLEKRYETSIETTWASKATASFQSLPGKITVYEKRWNIQVDEGSAEYMGERVAFTALAGATGQLTILSEFNSVAEMPAHLRSQLSSLQPNTASTPAPTAADVKPGQFYRLQNGATGLFVANNASQSFAAPIVQTNNPGRGAEWEFVPMGDHFGLRNRVSGMFIANFGSRENFAPLKQTNNPGSGAHWKLVPKGNGRFQLQNRLSGLFLANMQSAESQAPIRQVQNPGAGAVWQAIPRS